MGPKTITKPKEKYFSNLHLVYYVAFIFYKLLIKILVIFIYKYTVIIRTHFVSVLIW